MKTKAKVIASLTMALTLSSCSSIGHTPPSSFQIPPALSIELGSDGCPIEEPCWDYPAEDEALEALAWATFDSYDFVPQDLPYPIQQVFIDEAAVGDTEDLEADYFTLPHPYIHDVVFIFQSVALTAI